MLQGCLRPVQHKESAGSVSEAESYCCYDPVRPHQSQDQYTDMRKSKQAKIAHVGGKPLLTHIKDVQEARQKLLHMGVETVWHDHEQLPQDEEETAARFQRFVPQLPK